MCQIQKLGHMEIWKRKTPLRWEIWKPKRASETWWMVANHYVNHRLNSPHFLSFHWCMYLTMCFIRTIIIPSISVLFQNTCSCSMLLFVCVHCISIRGLHFGSQHPNSGRCLLVLCSTLIVIVCLLIEHSKAQWFMIHASSLWANKGVGRKAAGHCPGVALFWKPNHPPWTNSH